MANVRRFFRYEVAIPLWLEQTDNKKNYNNSCSDEAFPEVDKEKVLKIKEELKKLLGEINLDEETLHVFHVLSYKINFMAWLLEILLHNEDPSKKDDFKFRKRELSKLKIPSHLNSSKIGSLICGIEQTIFKHIEDILVTVDTNIDEKIFLYPFDEHELFEPIDYVLNLQELSMKGVTIARALELLIQKLNIWEGVYNRLKYLNKKISRPSEWQTHKVNLSSGGVSLVTEKFYSKFTCFNVFLGLDDTVMVLQGKLVACRELGNGGYQTSLAFDFLTVDNAELITLFIQRQELLEAMKKISLQSF